MPQPVAEFTTIESIFVRERNCLLLRGDFAPIFTDYYLHLMDIGEKHPEALDTTLKVYEFVVSYSWAVLGAGLGPWGLWRRCRSEHAHGVDRRG